MGQKTHPFLFKLHSKNFEWNSKYIENNSEEASFLFSKDLEIRSYISRILFLYGFILVECKMEYSVSKLHIFISFYDRIFHSISTNPKLNNNSYLNFEVSRKKLIINIINQIFIITFSTYKVEFKCIKLIFKNLNKRLESNIVINKKSKVEYQQLVKNIIINFEFKELIKVVSIVVIEKNSAILLAKIITLYIKKIQKRKKHNFLFLNLNKILSVLINSKLSNINGLKILVSGRLNGFPRSKEMFLSVGSIPLQSFNSKIDYYNDISYTVYGTIGVKVWIFEK